MEIPGLGTVTKDERWPLYVSNPLPVAILGGKICQIAVEKYEDDPSKADFHSAIANFLSLDKTVLREVEPHVFQYYTDMKADWQIGDDEFLTIESPSDMWKHVQFGSRPVVGRRRHGNKDIYISLVLRQR